MTFLVFPRPTKDTDINQLPGTLRNNLRQAISEINKEYLKNDITDPDSPEAQGKAIRILTKHGFAISSIE